VRTFRRFPTHPNYVVVAAGVVALVFGAPLMVSRGWDWLTVIWFASLLAFAAVCLSPLIRHWHSETP
jgi:hypothetical protein